MIQRAAGTKRRPKVVDGDSKLLAFGRGKHETHCNSMNSHPALTVGVVQPWAWGLIHGSQRELLLRLPAKKLGLHLVFTSKTRQYLTPAACRNFPGLPPADELIFGALIGTAEVIECVRVRADWRWTFANPRPIEPIVLETGALRFHLAQKVWKKLRYVD
jgi:hypothetical protein